MTPPDLQARVVAYHGGAVGRSYGQPVVAIDRHLGLFGRYGRVAKDGTVKRCPAPKS